MASNRLTTQTTYIDGTTLAATNVSALFAASQLGQIIKKDDRAYQLVLFDSGTNTIANGTPVCWKPGRANFTVTSEIDDTNANQVAGVALGTVTAGNYGWIQVRGNHPAVITNGDNDGVAGDIAIIDGSGDGISDVVAAGTTGGPTYLPLGTVTGTEAASLMPVDLFPPLNGV